jgi:hypothetical protein
MSLEKCSGTKPLIPFRALKGRQNLAQGGALGQEPLPPPWVRVLTRVLLSPELPALWRFGGRGRERRALAWIRESHASSFSQSVWARNISFANRQVPGPSP